MVCKPLHFKIPRGSCILILCSISVSTSDWDDHIFAHTLEDQAISDSTGTNLLQAPVTFHQQEQYDMPLIYAQSDQALAQELEKQVL